MLYGDQATCMRAQKIINCVIAQAIVLRDGEASGSDGNGLDVEPALLPSTVAADSSDHQDSIVTAGHDWCRHIVISQHVLKLGAHVSMFSEHGSCSAWHHKFDIDLVL